MAHTSFSFYNNGPGQYEPTLNVNLGVEVNPENPVKSQIDAFIDFLGCQGHSDGEILAAIDRAGDELQLLIDVFSE
jgi:hypothetical protein